MKEHIHSSQPTNTITNPCPSQTLEHSLSAVDQVLARLQAKAKQVQEELRELTRAQTDGGQKGQEEVEAAKKGIEV